MDQGMEQGVLLLFLFAKTWEWTKGVLGLVLGLDIMRKTSHQKGERSSVSKLNKHHTK